MELNIYIENLHLERNSRKTESKTKQTKHSGYTKLKLSKEEYQEIKYEKDWQESWKRLHDKPVQENIVYLIDRIQNDMFGCSYLNDLLSIIFAFIATVQYRVYYTKIGLDNLTALACGKYAYSLSEKALSKHTERDRTILNRILKKMPAGYEKYSISGFGVLRVYNGKDLTLRKAKETLDFLESKIFTDILNKIESNKEHLI